MVSPFAGASEMSFFLFTTGAFLTYPLGCVQRNRNGPARKCKTRNDSLSSLESNEPRISGVRASKD
jgi:hypothetical protein